MRICVWLEWTRFQGKTCQRNISKMLRVSKRSPLSLRWGDRHQHSEDAISLVLSTSSSNLIDLVSIWASSANHCNEWGKSCSASAGSFLICIHSTRRPKANTWLDREAQYSFKAVVSLLLFTFPIRNWTCSGSFLFFWTYRTNISVLSFGQITRLRNPRKLINDWVDHGGAWTICSFDRIWNWFGTSETENWPPRGFSSLLGVFPPSSNTCTCVWYLDVRQGQRDFRIVRNFVTGN